MKHQRDNLEDRLAKARQSKAAMMARIAQRSGQDDPINLKKAEQRQAILAARAIRQAEAAVRQQAVLAEQLLQQAASVEAARERSEQDAREAAEAAQREEILKIKQKEARDARYAARKARR